MTDHRLGRVREKHWAIKEVKKDSFTTDNDERNNARFPEKEME